MFRLRRIESRHWRHLKKITRNGFVFEDSYRPGNYWGTTLGGREKASGTSVTQVASYLARRPAKLPPDVVTALRGKYGESQTLVSW